MPKTILITGSTDGIGLETAKTLASLGHTVLLHGRNPAKLEAARKAIVALGSDADPECYAADLSRMTDVVALADAVAEKHTQLDVLINNAGIYAPGSITQDGLDVRFAVNTLAPYLLTQRLLPRLGKSGRVINVSSAAQLPVDPEALAGHTSLPDGAAYAQSKLALTMWSRNLALARGGDGPAVIAVNPGSMLGSKMVKEAFGVAGGDIGIGADILTRASIGDDFEDASGQYFDNDARRFAPPHPDALHPQKSDAIVRVIEETLAALKH